MTRTLATLLQANPATLRQQLDQLEQVSGRQSHDIRLSVEVTQAARNKIHDLGLDKNDTTAEELYHVLQQRLGDDDARLERALMTRAATHVSAEAKLMDGIVHALESEVDQAQVMALKTMTARKLLKKYPAKRLMKALGYRSFDSMVRQEAPALLIASALHVETAAWRKTWLDAYKKLKPIDFENRTLSVLHPSTQRWQTVADKLVSEQAHTVIGLPEIGALIVLPMPSERPKGMTIATIALALHELNNLSAAANYIRAAEVQADFGSRIKAVASQQVFLEAPHMPQALPWQLLQRYFAHTKAKINEDIFGPYVQADNFTWGNVEKALTRLCPALAFWENSAHLTFHHDGQAVSLNLIDVAISSCNSLVFEARTAYQAQQELWHELCLRYLNHENIERAVAGLLQPQLAYEPASEK